MDKPEKVADTALRAIVGDNLRRLMEKRPNLDSNPKLSVRSGIGVATISRIINGETAATLDTLGMLARAFELQPWQLMVPNLDSTNPQILQSISAKEAELYTRLRESIAKEVATSTASDSGFGTLPPFHPGKPAAGKKRESK
ncbi:helix-turn-helix domain-containing protein [Variovorax sp. RT4R15]|uniref:helix-turn-helix domain-containing protein n=1 Tax=Variovorax sp. RT4R15 TaxID=3443737 RepID=UPI003F446485